MGKSRKFTLELNSKSVGTRGAYPVHCALAYDRPCCKTAGYKLGTKGPFVHAELCICVKECPLCLGHTQLLTEPYARSCRTPSPRRIVSVINEAQMPARYVDASLAGFSNFTGNARKVVGDLGGWIDAFDTRKGRGALLAGPVGVGKTYLLVCLAKVLAERGLSVKFIDFFQLLAQIRGAYSEHRSDQELLNPLIDVDVLLIDELGKGRNTEFELVILDQLVMGRYNQNKAIIASTNCHLQPAKGPSPTRSVYEIPLDQRGEREATGFGMSEYGSLESRVGERIFSRLMEVTEIFELKGSDYRRRPTP